MVTRIRQHNKIQARNFVQEEAQKRMYEIIEASQKQITNAIFVHASQIIYFSQNKSGIKCPCRDKVITNNALPINSNGCLNGVVKIDTTGPLFGTTYTDTSVADEMLDDDLISEESNNGINSISSLFGNSTDCPICYRSGTLPGYQPLGYSRKIFTTNKCSTSSGYFIDSSKAVPDFVCEDMSGGYVSFELDIPLVWIDFKYAVYNNKELLRDADIRLNGLDFKSSVSVFSGETANLEIRGCDFTHVVIDFKITNKKWLADFPQDQKPKDYTLFDSTQPVQIVLDKSVPTINNGDVIYKVDYGTFWKVNDFEYFRLQDKTVIGWSLSARLVQADETYKLLNTFIN